MQKNRKTLQPLNFNYFYIKTEIMKLPSFQFLSQSVLEVTRRFPFVLLSIFISTIAIFLLIHGFNKEASETIFIKLAMASALGLPLFFAVHIFVERAKPLGMFRFIILVVSAGLLVQFYFLLGNIKNAPSPIYYRYFFWSVGFHLFAAFSAFYVREEINGFWQFNKVLFLRFLTAALYSSVLYLGLAGALLAIQELFSVDINSKVYTDLWVIIAGLFNTVFFLGGIPKPLDSLQEDSSYPKGLKIFTQYVLIPLVTIYLLILYAYTAKILIQMNLPKGWVANLIIGFSIAGILSLLLVYPVRDLEENKWLKTFSRFFYFSLLPLVVLLFIAIGIRISEYGVTIERYIVAMLGTWLAIITLYFVFSKHKNIIVIPVSLCVFAFGSIIGPWGMFQVSERSQLKRLELLLEKNGAILNGKIVKLSEEKAQHIKIKEVNQINSIFDYLASNHGLKGMKHWLSKSDGDRIFNDSLSNEYDNCKYEIQKCIGLYGYNNNSYAKDENEMNLTYYCNQFQNVEGLDISGYDHIFNFSSYEYQDDRNVDSTGANFQRLRKNELQLFQNAHLICSVKLDKIVAQLKLFPRKSDSVYDIKPEQMTFGAESLSGQKLKLMFSNLSITLTDSSTVVNSVNGYLLSKDLK